eukprot:gene16378-biopygen7586
MPEPNPRVTLERPEKYPGGDVETPGGQTDQGRRTHGNSTELTANAPKPRIRRGMSHTTQEQPPRQSVRDNIHHAEGHRGRSAEAIRQTAEPVRRGAHARGLANKRGSRRTHPGNGRVATRPHTQRLTARNRGTGHSHHTTQPPALGAREEESQTG